MSILDCIYQLPVNPYNCHDSRVTIAHLVVSSCLDFIYIYFRNMQNLLLATTSATPLMKIGDFGFAR